MMAAALSFRDCRIEFLFGNVWLDTVTPINKLHEWTLSPAEGPP